MEEADYLRLSRRMRNLVGPYAKGFCAGLDRAFLNQREFKERHPDLPQHKYCLRKKDAWGDGYKHGFEGQEPQPPRGAPKSGQPTKTHTIRLRVTKQQAQVYAERGGNEWFLSLLEPQQDEPATAKKAVAKRKPPKADAPTPGDDAQSVIDLSVDEQAPDHVGELNAA